MSATKYTKPRGFIALMSAIVISIILLIIAATGSLAGYYSRSNVLEYELKDRSMALADACVDSLLLKLANSSLYPAGTSMPDTVAVSGDQCQVLAAVNPAGNPRIFQIQAVYHNAYTNLQITVDVNTLTVSGWQEVAHF